MQTAVAQKPVKEKSDTGASVQLHEAKVEAEKETGTEAGIPLYLEHSSALHSATPPPNPDPSSGPSKSDSSVVQHMCSACQEEQALEPDAVQTLSDTEQPDSEIEQEVDSSTNTVMRKHAADDLQTDTSTVEADTSDAHVIQHMCAECEKELDTGEASSVQAKPDGAESAAPPDKANNIAASGSIQFWNCTEYGKPTCTAPEDEAVQTKCAACEEDDQVQHAGSRNRNSSMIHAQAHRGIKAASSPLPHSDRIQAAFGRHDISHVRANIGGDAAAANKRMGAHAFTSGDRIGFRESPSLHLAAHEAAHVVQQREGLSLPDNIGRAGDRWERHADQVADAVTAGESAEPLLNQVADHSSVPGADSSSTVQHQITSGASRKEEPPIRSIRESGGQGGRAAESGQAEQSESEQEEVSAEEGMEAVASAESSTEAVDPDSACESAEEGAQEEQATQSPPGEAEAGEEASGPVEKGRCYNATAEAPPDDTPDPSQDSPPNDVEEESSVSFPSWEEPNDTCECEVGEELVQAAGQIPAEVSPESETASAMPQQQSENTEAAESGPAMASTGEATASAGAGGGEDTATAMPADSSAVREAERDAAIMEYAAATDMLRTIPERADRLSSGISFSPAGQRSEADMMREENARSMISSFLSSASAQVEEAVIFVQSEVPGRLASLAESTKAYIDAVIESEKEMVSSRIRSARSTATASSSAARAQILSEYSISVDTVNAETDAAIQALESEYDISTGEIAELEDSALLEVNSRFTDSREDHETMGTTKGSQTITTGQEHVDAYEEKCKYNNERESYGDDGFWDGCLSMRRKRAQQDAACKTASGMYKNIVRTANQKAFNLREQRTQYRCAVISGAGEVQSTLDQTIEQLTSGLESGRAGVLSGLSQARDMNLQAVDAALAATLQGYDRQAREQRQAINDSGYVQQLAVEQLAHTAAASLARGVGSAMASLESTLGQLREQLTQGDAPDADALMELLSTAETGLSGGMGTLLEKMEQGTAAAETQLSDAGLNASTSLHEITSSNNQITSEAEARFSNQISTLLTSASSAMGQLTEKQVQKAAETADQGVASMMQLVDGYSGAIDQIYDRVDQATDTSLDELEQELDNMLGKLDAKIVSEAWKAASKEQPAWKGVVAIVLIILVIIASIVVSVLTLGAGAPFLAVVLVGAIVGAITAGLIQVINNWAAGEEWDKGLVQAMVIGAVGGALGGAIGAGANGLAQAAVQGAIRAGASTATRVAINVGINLAGDMVSEGLTQGFGYIAYGQSFNWQGFVMAGGMSVASTARAGAAGAAPRARGVDVSAPTPTPAPRASGSSVRGAMADLGVGLGLAGGTELLNVAMGGKFDANRFFSSAASGAAGSRAAARGAQAPRAPRRPPTTRLGRARARVAGARDAAFSRMEIPESSSARQRVERGMGSVEEWFASGAGGLLRRGAGAESGQAPTRVPETTAPETPTVRAPETGEIPRTRTGETGEVAPSRRSTTDEGVTAGQPSRRTESIEPTGPSARARNEVDANAPVNRISDAELSAMTNTKARVGDADHDVSVRRTDNEVNCEICSRACGAVKRKIAEINGALESNTTPRAQELKNDLESISSRVKEAEDRIEGRFEEGVYQAGREVIDLARSVANDFQSLGVRHRELGDAINNPSQIRQGDLFPFSGNKGDVRVTLLEGSNQLVRTTTEVGASDFRRIVNGENSILQPGQQCIYVLRRNDGTILKVGKSSAGGADNRFRIYQNASELIPGGLRLEVTPLKPGLGESAASGLEGQLRGRLEAEGHIMPWDSTGGRLGRPGPGVPGEVHRPLLRDDQGRVIRTPDANDPTKLRTRRGPPEFEWEGTNLRAADPNSVRLPRLPRPEEADLRTLMREHSGNVRAVADALTATRNYPVAVSTVYSWLSKYRISTSEF